MPRTPEGEVAFPPAKLADVKSQLETATRREQRWQAEAVAKRKEVEAALEAQSFAQKARLEAPGVGREEVVQKNLYFGTVFAWTPFPKRYVITLKNTYDVINQRSRKIIETI